LTTNTTCAGLCSAQRAEKYLLTILRPKVLIFVINYYFYVSEKNVGALLPMDFLIRKHFISSLVALLITGCTALLAQKTSPADKTVTDKATAKKEQSEAPKKDDAAAAMPGYYNSYASAGLFRNEEKRSISLKQQNLLVSVPVLASLGLTAEQSKALFKQAMVFQLTGYDAETKFANENGKGNVSLSPAVKELIGKDFSGLDQLYDIQVQQGNVLVVDGETKFPLMIQGGTYAPEFNYNDELTEYHSAIYYWAAAYPWLFYEINNSALRQTLLEKDMRLLGYFAQHRFGLNAELYQAIMDNNTPFNPQTN
jgi:hypothetical protein